jgi:hypothetical protein
MGKYQTCTFDTGVVVYAKYMGGKVIPYEFKSELACERHQYKLFNQGIMNTMIIKSFTNPKKFYLQIINNPQLNNI